MGVYVSVRGWIEGNREQLAVIRRMTVACSLIKPYLDSWHFPETGGGYSAFAFFGCTVREHEVAIIREHIRAIAETVSTRDGDEVDYTEGIFSLAHEQPELNPSVIWRFADGAMVEQIETQS